MLYALLPALILDEQGSAVNPNNIKRLSSRRPLYWIKQSVQQLVSPPLSKIRLRRGWEGIKGRVITPTQTLPRQGKGHLVELQRLLEACPRLPYLYN